MPPFRHTQVFSITLVLLALLEGAASAQSGPPALVLGIRITAGGRFDNVRRCVASPVGTKGGPAADIQLFAEFGLGPDMSLTVNLPVMRPILFAAAFKILQLEPDVALTWRRRASDTVDWIVGPSLGVSIHYGPDYASEISGPAKGAWFFAIGPTFGAYVGLDFKRDSAFNFQMGLHPYITPLFGVSDPASHKGVVIGGMLEGQFRFAQKR